MSIFSASCARCKLSEGYQWFGLRLQGALVASALVVAVILAALVFVLRESVIFLVLLISPLAHHVVEFSYGPGEISSEFLVSHLHVESVAEATDGVFVGDLCDCCACFEETTHITS